MGKIQNKDHPRRCGENLHIPAATVKEKGSPPQVRGKLVTVAAHDAGRRITPAGAGKTVAEALGMTPAKDHPRRCGENAPLRSAHPRCAGSPPQVRGKLVDIVVWVVGLRITPAGAGKTLKRSFKNQPFCS